MSNTRNKLQYDRFANYFCNYLDSQVKEHDEVLIDPDWDYFNGDVRELLK